MKVTAAKSSAAILSSVMLLGCAPRGALDYASLETIEYLCRHTAEELKFSSTGQSYHVSLVYQQGRKEPEVVAAWRSRLGYMPHNKDGYLSNRDFSISYRGTIEDPWKVDRFKGEFPIRLSEPLKPLYAFITLDSGEHVQFLLTNSEGGGAPYIVYPHSNVIVAMLYVSDPIFLRALGRSSVMAVDFKYADGKTLQHERYSVSLPRETMQSALATVIEKSKDLPGSCRYVEQGVEV